MTFVNKVIASGSKSELSNDNNSQEEESKSMNNL